MATKITTRVLADDAVTDAKIADVTLTTATQAASDNTTKIATTAYVTTAIANLADSAPSTLNTLNELAAALGDDANFSTTVTNSIAGKLPLAGGTMTGNITSNESTFSIFNNDIRFKTSGAETMLRAVGNGAVELMHNNVTRVATSADGATITGKLLIGADSGDAFNDDAMLRLQRTGDRVFQQFKCDADQNIQILFGDVDDDVESSIQYYPADKNLIFATGNNQDAMTIDSSQNVGIGTTNPQAKFDVTVGNAKTASAGVWGYLGKTNESSGYQALQCFQIGGSAADERRYEFQTIEQGASNDGIICLQKSGGRVFIGHDSADGNSDKLVISGSIGISNDGYIGAGSGFGPSNGAGSSSTIQLYSSSTGNMTFATNYSAGDEVHNMSGNTKFVVKRSAAGTSAVQFYTNDGGYQTGALNNGYHHTMRISGPSTYYWDNACQASGGFSTYSDEKLKKEITTITGALDKVAVMNGVTFKWKDAAKRGSGDTGKQFGVIAQNMLEVDSELPTLNVDPLETNENIEDNSKDTDYYTMDYSRLTPYFIEAIKELKTKLEAAEARIATLEG